MNCPKDAPYLLAPVVRGRKGEYRKEIAEFQKKGFQRLKIDGEYYAIDDVPTLDKKFKHDIDVVVDRIVARADIASRLADSARDRAGPRRGHRGDRACRREGRQGQPEAHHLLVEVRLPGLRLHDSGDRAAAVLVQQSLRRLPDLRRHRPRDAHRRRPGGAGRQRAVEARCHRALGEIDSPYYGQTLDSIAKHKFSTGTRWDDLPEKIRTVILYGSGTEAIRFAYDDGLRAYEVKKPFEGVITNLERRYKETESDGRARRSVAS